jgi:putative hydrolase of the HAD superfamily
MSTNHKEYKHVSFDLWMTLIKSDPVFKLERNGLLRSHFHLRQDEIVIGEIVRKHDLYYNRHNEQTGESVPSDAMWRVILADLGVEAEAATKERIADFELKAESLFYQYPPKLIDEATGDILYTLHSRGITLNILSNTGFTKGRLLRRLLNDWGIGAHFHFQVYSDEVGYSKPHRGIFDAMWSELEKINSVGKHEVLHIGDNSFADVEGAFTYGITGKLFCQTTNSLSDCLDL